MKVAHQEPAIPLQLPLAPMRLFAIGVEHALDAAV
jgi:hypothetical protein